jgi:limonene-1,2-epoxide hydrolase
MLSIVKWLGLRRLETDTFKVSTTTTVSEVKAVLPSMEIQTQEEEIIMAVEKAMASSSLVEVIDRILDKGVVVDAWVRMSLVGIELLSIEARVVLASVETYLKYAEAIGLTATAAAA